MDILDKTYFKQDDNLIDYTTLLKWNAYISNIDESDVSIYELTMDMVEKYKFNFYGLLTELNIPNSFFYPHLLVNGLKTSTDFTIDMVQIKIINSDVLEKMKNDIQLEISR